VCDANSGLVNLGGGVVVDTQSDLPHGRQMIELFGKVWRAMPKRVINTHEDGDHAQVLTISASICYSFRRARGPASDTGIRLRTNSHGSCRARSS
jgi:glyoxylase-like metal-dependent hydrolase (beta-lactamase superfamily II)